MSMVDAYKAMWKNYAKFSGKSQKIRVLVGNPGADFDFYRIQPD